MPFVRQQIDVGEFIYDGALAAMRATLYGLESGAVDLLITDRETYQLSGLPQDAFELPQLCTRAAEVGLPPVGHGLPPAMTASCSDCHTTRQ